MEVGMPIKEWPHTERPREKLLSRGPGALSDAELLAIFIRTGVRGQTAVDVARSALARLGGLRELCDSERHAFCGTPGLGSAKYVEIRACLELGRRYLERHRVICFEELFHGTIDGAGVHPREVVRRALGHNAAAMIVTHNHPSGVAEPSRADRALTRRLQEAAALIDVRLLDHVVIGDGETVSFADRGWI
jgi:DNA repair protein RadC